MSSFHAYTNRDTCAKGVMHCAGKKYNALIQRWFIVNNSMRDSETGDGIQAP